jgi:hypothetical protein
MRKHVLMWWLAGGATLLGTSLAYIASRPRFAPAVSRVQAGVMRVRESRAWERAWENGAWISRKLGEKIGDGLGNLLRKDRGGRGGREEARPVVRNAAFEEYRAAELARLEDEERDFHAYLERLRAARDRDEFEAFMQDRRAR